MDWERARITADVYGMRAKAKLLLVVQLAGLALVLLAAHNLLFAQMLNTPVWAPYRIFGAVYSSQKEVAFFVGDVVAMAVGAAIVWWT